MSLKKKGVIALLSIASTAILSIASSALADTLPHVRFATTAGDFVVELYPDKAPKTEVSKKKPYTKPAFRFERVFETQALSCGKIFASQGSCKFNQ